MSQSADLKTSFEKFTDILFAQLQSGESLSLALRGENSQFIRFNNSKIRQIGNVQDLRLQLSFYANGKFCKLDKDFCQSDNFQNLANDILNNLRLEIDQLPEDPYAKPPVGQDISESRIANHILPLADAPKILADQLVEVNLSGIYSAGPVYRASANSAGARHWFESSQTTFDYSFITPERKTIKATLNTTDWNTQNYHQHLDRTKGLFAHLFKKPIAVKPGKYRVYLAPACVDGILGLMSWNGFSEAKIRQGQSALCHLRTGEKSLSTEFNLAEDFSSGNVPRFNNQGELAPLCTPLITNGKLVQALVNTRSSNEYGVPANGANDEEAPRSLVLKPGQLAEADILKKLGTGLYLSNLHYLNWSDRLGARITGMTRFACFWVENGEIQGPLAQDLRFDDCLYSLFGENLEALTQTQQSQPDLNSYDGRECAEYKVPGALIKEFTLTL